MTGPAPSKRTLMMVEAYKARRTSDLVVDGKVLDSGQRRRSPGGRTACVWRLV